MEITKIELDTSLPHLYHTRSPLLDTKMPRIKRYTTRLSFHTTPELRAWYEQESVRVNRPASELFREALDKYAQITDAMRATPVNPPVPPSADFLHVEASPISRVDAPPHPDDITGATPPRARFETSVEKA